jgi:protein-S-isoprenylcysteine O-methyltransferase Ste14
MSQSRDAMRYASHIAVPMAVFLLAPAVAGAEYLLHPAPWAGFVCGVLTLVSQPTLSAAKLFGDESDKGSALGILLAVVLANAASVAEFSLRDLVLPEPGSLWTIAGVLVAACGMALRLWAIKSLGNYFTSTVSFVEGQPVTTAGPYRFMRHPSYAGSLVTVVGTTLALGSALGLVLAGAMVAPAYLYRIRVEERQLIAMLGDEYTRYRDSTPALLPTLWPNRHSG